MKYTSVIFDLFGTLVPDIAGPPYLLTAKQMAKVLSIPSGTFVEMWFGTAYERNIGVFKTVQDNIKYICTKLNARINEEQVSRATQIRYEFVQQAMNTPIKHSLETIAELKRAGIKIGLVSDCSPSEPEIWQTTPFQPLFDVTIFSSIAEFKKPDLRIYQLAMKNLQVRENECVYVGNGGSNEIEGAFKAGLFPILILPESDSETHLQPGKGIIEYAKEHGKMIRNIDEILTLFR